MGHSITALIVAEPFDEAAAREWDVAGAPLGHGSPSAPGSQSARGSQSVHGLRLVHITAAYAAYQQDQRGGTTLDVPEDFPPTFPREGVLADLAAAVTGRNPATFALIMTNFFGGAGNQWAIAYVDGQRVPEVRDVNAALRTLGVHADNGMDEWDTVGLANHRHTPESRDRYWDLAP